MKKRVLGVMILVICMCASMLFANGSEEKASSSAAQSGPVTLKYAFWGNPEAIGVEQDIITAFEKEHPEIKIETVVSAYDDYHTKIQTMIAGNMAPDIMRIDDYYFYDFQKLGVLENLNPYIEKDKIDMSIYPTMGIEEATVDGKVYGLPWGYAPLYMLINLDTFEKYGVTPPSMDWTLDDFEKLVKAFPAKDGIYGFACGTKNLSGILPFIWAKNGAVLTDDKSQYVGDSKEAVAGVKLLSDLYQQGYFPKDCINATADTLRRWFSNGTLAMTIGSAQEILAVQKIQGVRFEAWTMPQSPTNKHTTVNKSNDICICSASKQKAAAWTFLKFLRGKEGESLYVAAKRFPPTLNIPENWDVYLNAGEYPKQIKEVSQAIVKDYSHNLPLRTGYAAIESKILPAFQASMLGTMTAEQAMTSVKADITKIIQQNSK